jgi:hypothetical protein
LIRSGFIGEERDASRSELGEAVGSIGPALLVLGLTTALVTAGCTDEAGSVSAQASGEAPRTISQPVVASRIPVAPESERVDLTMPTFSDPTNVTNPLFPVSLQESVLMLGHVDGKPFRTEVTLLPETRIIEWEGQRVETLVSQYNAYLGGRIEEVAYDYYATRPELVPLRRADGPGYDQLAIPDPSAWNEVSRGLDLGETLGERARSALVAEDADTVDGALEHGVRECRQLRALDEEHGVVLRRELVHDLALAELPLDGLLVVGFDDDPWSVLHDRTSFLLLQPGTLPKGPEAELRPP